MSEFDQARREAFAGKMAGILNGGMLALMTSMGHRTGLFETMARMPPSTSADIAKASALNERYVREWLGAMTTGGIVEYDAQAQTYVLPREHGAVITSAAGPRNMARFAQYIAMAADVEEDVLACFRRGGGVPYEKFARFSTIMAESSTLRFDHLLTEKILPLAQLDDSLAEGIEALDIGCGSGHAANLLAQAFPRSRFAGYDFSEEGISAARSEARAMGNENVRFETRDLAILAEPGRYDLITAFDVIHDQARPTEVLLAVANALAQGGVFLMMDVRASSNLADNLEHPMGPFLYSLSTMHCMTVSLALDGAGLGTVWGEQKAMAMLNEAGFPHVEIHRLDEEPLQNFYVARRG